MKYRLIERKNPKDTEPFGFFFLVELAKVLVLFVSSYILPNQEVKILSTEISLPFITQGEDGPIHLNMNLNEKPLVSYQRFLFIE